MSDGPEFAPGTAALLVGTPLAGHLARIQRRLPDQEFEVVLLESGEAQALHGRHLETLPLLQEVMAWQQYLRQEHPAVDVLSCMQRLRELPITVELLQKTSVGKAVNRLVKTAHSGVSTTAKNLVRQWRDMYQRQKAQSQAKTLELSAREPSADAANQALVGLKEPSKDIQSKLQLELPEDVSTHVGQPTTEKPQKRRRTLDIPAEPASGDIEVLTRGQWPELAHLDHRIVCKIVENPHIKEFLDKHRSVYRNLNKDSVEFLTRQFQHSKEMLKESSGVSEAARTVTISNLPPQVLEQDMHEMLQGSGLTPDSVLLPRESRRQRFCGVAFVVLASREAAVHALRLHGRQFQGRTLHVELIEGSDQPAITQRVLWQEDEQLWELALFDRTESVSDFRARLCDPIIAPNPSADHARFQNAAMREHADERAHVRQALAGN